MVVVLLEFDGGIDLGSELVEVRLAVLPNQLSVDLEFDGSVVERGVFNAVVAAHSLIVFGRLVRTWLSRFSGRRRILWRARCSSERSWREVGWTLQHGWQIGRVNSSCATYVAMVPTFLN